MLKRVYDLKRDTELFLEMKVKPLLSFIITIGCVTLRFAWMLLNT